MLNFSQLSQPRISALKTALDSKLDVSKIEIPA
jgi:hypothetical protein